MKRISLLSAAVLLASLGADGSPDGLCGHGMDTNAGLIESADSGGIVDGGGGMPDGAPMGGPSGKAPHLINFTTGEDLGLLIDLQTLTVFSEKFNALFELGTVQPTRSVPIYFTEADCYGKRYITPPVLSPPQLANKVVTLGPQATYLQPTGSVLHDLFIGSQLKNAGGTVDGMLECSNVGAVVKGNFIEYIDTRVKRRPPDEQLKVELR